LLHHFSGLHTNQAVQMIDRFTKRCIICWA